MSWGYFVDLRLSVPSDNWSALLAKRIADFDLEQGWSNFSEEELESEMGSYSGDGDTFKKLLKWKVFRAPSAVNEVVAGDDETTLRICVLLDKSQLELAGPLARMLYASAEAGATGSLRIVNDGTYSGEDGSELTLARPKGSAKSKIKSAKLRKYTKVRDELSAEMLARMGIEI